MYGGILLEKFKILWCTISVQKKKKGKKKEKKSSSYTNRKYTAKPDHSYRGFIGMYMDR